MDPTFYFGDIIQHFLISMKNQTNNYHIFKSELFMKNTLVRF